MEPQISVELRHINKSFGDFQASKDISLKIGRGKLTALLGPSHGNQFLRKRLENDFQGTHLSVKKIALQNLSGLKIPQALS